MPTRARRVPTMPALSTRRPQIARHTCVRHGEHAIPGAETIEDGSAHVQPRSAGARARPRRSWVDGQPADSGPRHRPRATARYGYAQRSSRPPGGGNPLGSAHAASTASWKAEPWGRRSGRRPPRLPWNRRPTAVPRGDGAHQHDLLLNQGARIRSTAAEENKRPAENKERL